MSATRASRRFFVGLGILLLMLGFVAIFHSSQQQMDELRLAGLRCEQQQVILNAQIETESAKLVRLEQGLNAEKQSHRRLQNDMQQKIKSEKDIKDKAITDWNLRFTSLQQHYKLLKSEHEDLKEDCSKTRRKNLEDISGYQVKVKSLQGQLTQLERRKQAEIDEWKTKYHQLAAQKADLDKALDSKLNNNDDSNSINLLKYKNRKLEDDMEVMKSHCAYRLGQEALQSSVGVGKSASVGDKKSFDAQVLVSEDSYKIPMNIRSQKSTYSSSIATNLPPTSTNKTTNGVGDKVAIADSHGHDLGIINSVENFQMIPNGNENGDNVLKEPPVQGGQVKVSSSTATLDKADLKSKPSVERAPPIAAIPTISSPKTKKVPEGVVPIPESMNELMKREIEEKEKEDSKNRPPNRYSNAIGQESPFAADQKLAENGPGDTVNALQNGNEIDNGAHEVNDNNDFNIVEDKNHHDHLQNVLDDENINLINNNAAEVEANFDGKDKAKGNDDIDLNIINRNLQLSNDLQGNPKRMNGHPKMSNDKFNEEVAGDQGFDEHLEEPVEEEDDDEYSNLAARHEGQAVRN